MLLFLFLHALWLRILEPFLELLRLDMSKHPRRIVRFPSTLLKKACSLVKGVKADLDGPLTGED